MEGIIYSRMHFEDKAVANRYVVITERKTFIRFDLFEFDAEKNDFICTKSKAFPNAEILLNNGNMLGLYEGQELVLVNMAKMYQKIGTTSSLESYGLPVSAMPFLSVNSFNNKYVIVSCIPVRANIAVQYDGDGKQPIEFHLRHFGEEYQKRINIGRAKKDLVMSTDISQTIAYLEVQIDFLTKLVFSMYEGLLPSARDRIASEIDGFYKIKDSLENHSVLNIKPLDSCMKELQEKKNFRAKQKKYYDIKRENE